jgi:hypothetical protein
MEEWKREISRFLLAAGLARRGVEMSIINRGNVSNLKYHNTFYYLAEIKKLMDLFIGLFRNRDRWHAVMSF